MTLSIPPLNQPILPPKTLAMKVENNTRHIDSWKMGLPKDLQLQLVNFFFPYPHNISFFKLKISHQFLSHFLNFPLDKVEGFSSIMLTGCKEPIEQFALLFQVFASLEWLDRLWLADFHSSPPETLKTITRFLTGSRITSLQLSGIPLTYIPPEFKNLEQLRKVNLQYNGLKTVDGNFPPTLHDLDIRGNPIERFQGSITTENLNLLVESNVLPTGIEFLTSIPQIVVTIGADFSPDLSPLDLLPSFVIKSDTRNPNCLATLSKPYTFSHTATSIISVEPLRLVRKLVLNFAPLDEPLHTPLLQKIATLTHLSFLRVRSYKGSTIPDEIGELPTLEGLYISLVTGPIPASISNSSKLSLSSLLFFRNNTEDQASKDNLNQQIEKYPAELVNLSTEPFDFLSEFGILPITRSDLTMSGWRSVLDQLSMCPIEIGAMRYESGEFDNTAYRIELFLKTSPLMYNAFFASVFGAYLSNPENGESFESSALETLLIRLREAFRTNCQNWDSKAEAAFLRGKIIPNEETPPEPSIFIKGGWTTTNGTFSPPPSHKSNRAEKLHKEGLFWNT